MSGRTMNTQDFAERMVAFFESAGDGHDLTERLGFAETTVHIHVCDPGSPTPTAGCTIAMRGGHVGGECRITGDAEVTLTASTTTLLDVIYGDQALPIAILAGDVRYSGPVRKFLRVVPIFQNLDFGVWRQDRLSAEVGAAAG